MRNSITDHMTNSMALKLLWIELVNWDTTIFVKQLLNCSHKLATNLRFQQKSIKTFCENQ